jgi:hypothetical protein
MSVLWVGGEDIDFPVSISAPSFTFNATGRRSGYARGGISNQATVANMFQSKTFPGGAVTSGWLSAQIYYNITGTSKLAVGVSLSTTAKGLYVGTNASTSSKLTLYKYDGTTLTALASESGTSVGAAGSIAKLDVQIVNYGATATVNVYLNSILLIAYSGDVTVSGMTNFDTVSLPGNGAGVSNPSWAISEIILANEDTRAWPGVMTLALTGAGTTNNWTNNTFSNINGTTISDANPTSVNVSAQDQQYNVTDLPAGSFVIPMVKISARMAVSASPAVTQVKLGYNSGGTVGFGTGATKLLTAVYATYEQFDSINPVTGLAWAQSDMNALQLEMQSLT